MKIVFAGGGTGGHLFPIIAVAREIKKIYAGTDLKLYYIGPKENSYGLSLLEQEGVVLKTITTGKFRRYFSLQNFIDIFKVPVGILQALFHLFFLAPDTIFSKGGYGSFPTVFAGWLLGVPIFLHESDVVPGLASKIESKWALEIFTSFPNTEYFPKKRMIQVGNPVRDNIMNGDRKEAKKIFGLQDDKALILIMGGSQGSKKINEVILDVLIDLLKNFEVIHQIGENQYKEVSTEAKALLEEDLKKYYHPFPFLNEYQLRNALFACDLVVSRAGAGAIFEIAATGKPAILIPLSSSAGNHQSKNAYQFAKSGAAEILEEENFKPHFFLEKINYLFSRKDVLRQMAESSLNFSRPKSAQIIANYIIEYLSQALE